jgi:hypothetical protein
MKCPQCNNELVLRSPAWNNVEIYGGTANVYSLCCQKPIVLYRVSSFRAAPGHITGEDDWGYEQGDTREYKD